MSYDTSKINVTGATSYLQDLDRRSRDIFRTMVKIFLETGEPVGSRSLSRQLPVSLSPASVRNIMFDLEQLGLIYAPHISAGRLPTDCGLRFFVDSLLEVGDLSEEERQEIDVQVRAKQSGMTSEQLLTEASQMLSGLSQGAGVVLTYKEDARLRHVEFVRIEPRRALVVLVFDKGSIENRVIDLPSGLPASALTEASNFLTNIIRNRTIGEARQELEQQLATKEAELHQLTRKIVKMGIAQWAGEGEEEIGSLIVRGRSNLLLDVDAQADLDRIRLLFDDLESKREMIRLLQLTETGEGVRIFIGSENKLFSLSGSSLILSSYRDGNDRIVGALGVIGPTRLNYARIIPMVDYTAKIISRMLE